MCDNTQPSEKLRYNDKGFDRELEINNLRNNNSIIYDVKNFLNKNIIDGSL